MLEFSGTMQPLEHLGLDIDTKETINLCSIASRAFESRARLIPAAAIYPPESIDISLSASYSGLTLEAVFTRGRYSGCGRCSLATAVALGPGLPEGAHRIYQIGPKHNELPLPACGSSNLGQSALVFGRRNIGNFEEAEKKAVL